MKKKYYSGLKFSNLMNIGKKKPLSLENPEKCVDISGTGSAEGLESNMGHSASSSINEKVETVTAFFSSILCQAT